MAMLAEPRRKQKVINLRAKNNAWSNDNTKFGQRMLEKMGWTSGKGLGANENGITEHVIARYKNDEKGLGFEDKNDQWTKHEDDFNALLANLSNANDNTENLHSGISLEDKSKKSKARIHYHKFTRGKDISRYSEKDLANIFGKKSFKSEEKEILEEPLKEHLKTTEQVFTEKGSMDDYFKNKLAAIKLKNKLNVSEKAVINDETDYAFCGFSQETDDMEVSYNGFGYNYQDSQQSLDTSEGGNVLGDSENSKKKKKKSKNKDNLKLIEQVNELSTDIHNDVVCQDEKCIAEKIKKKKKSKNKTDNDLSKTSDEICTDNKQKSDASFKQKNKSKNRDLLQPSNIVSLICDNSVKDDDFIKKKKKAKNIDHTQDDVVKSTLIENCTAEVQKEKKKHKNYTDNCLEDIPQVPKKKKKKKC